MAIQKLVAKGFEVRAIGFRKGEVVGVEVFERPIWFDEIHTVSIYLNKNNQKEYYDYILSLNPKRVIFNPGSENIDLELLLTKHKIFFERACTLVLLSIGGY